MDDKIKQLISDEYVGATLKFGAFNSAHEGYAVLLEEVDEAKDEYLLLESLVRELWRYTRMNNDYHQIAEAIAIYKVSIELAKEAIQVAAMAKRFMYDIHHQEIE